MENKHLVLGNYGRYCIGIRELSCGDCFEIETSKNVWTEVRIEYDDTVGWYLINNDDVIIKMPFKEYPAKISYY